jgi:hypothetical protein
MIGKLLERFSLLKVVTAALSISALHVYMVAYATGNGPLLWSDIEFISAVLQDVAVSLILATLWIYSIDLVIYAVGSAIAFIGNVLGLGKSARALKFTVAPGTIEQALGIYFAFLLIYSGMGSLSSALSGIALSFALIRTARWVIEAQKERGRVIYAKDSVLEDGEASDSQASGVFPLILAVALLSTAAGTGMAKGNYMLNNAPVFEIVTDRGTIEAGLVASTSRFLLLKSDKDLFFLNKDSAVELRRSAGPP